MDKNNNKIIFQKGFTIIELIVVIAIIAVLAAIVLVNVTQYINKGRDASIKANLTTTANNATIYFDSDATYKGTYTNFCSNLYATAPKSAILRANSGTDGTDYLCYAEATSWCACATLKGGSNDTFCVDSTGYKKQSESTTCTGRCHNDTTKYCSDTDS